jgi:DNA-binding NtrC family response regulator
MKKKILIADDEKDVCESMGSVFKRRGYEVTVVFCGKDALERIREDFYPVIILDIKMPDLYGSDILKEAVKLHPASKVIVMTGYGKEGEDEYLRLGAHSYITKPIRPREAFQIIDKLFDWAEIS